VRSTSCTRVTNLVANAGATVGEYADAFGLHPTAFVPITSSHYGYGGSLTLFDPERLHRFEVITPHEPHQDDGPVLRQRSARELGLLAASPRITNGRA